MGKKNDYTGDLLLYPNPVALVTVKDDKYENIFTVSWIGIVSSHPECISISVNPKRYSYDFIKKTQKFCVNIPTVDMIEKVDFCGSHTGREIDKFNYCSFSKEYFDKSYIIVDQCPFSLVCDVITSISLGSHDIFIAKVRKKFMDSSISDIHNQLNPVGYFRPFYYGFNNIYLGEYGFTKGDRV